MHSNTSSIIQKLLEKREEAVTKEKSSNRFCRSFTKISRAVLPRPTRLALKKKKKKGNDRKVTGLKVYNPGDVATEALQVRGMMYRIGTASYRFVREWQWQWRSRGKRTASPRPGGGLRRRKWALAPYRWITLERRVSIRGRTPHRK